MTVQKSDLEAKLAEIQEVIDETTSAARGAVRDVSQVRRS